MHLSLPPEYIDDFLIAFAQRHVEWRLPFVGLEQDSFEFAQGQTNDVTSSVHSANCFGSLIRLTVLSDGSAPWLSSNRTIRWIAQPGGEM